MKKYTIIYEIFGKKRKSTLKAKSNSEAIEIFRKALLSKVSILDFESEDEHHFDERLEDVFKVLFGDAFKKK